jgi:hypothetical protein
MSSILLIFCVQRAKPGEQIEVQVRTKPNAYVALLGVDQAVISLHKDSAPSTSFDITREEVIKELNSYDNTRPEKPSWYRRRKRSMQPDRFLTAGEILDQSGLIMLTDAKVFRYSPNSKFRTPQSRSRD